MSEYTIINAIYIYEERERERATAEEEESIIPRNLQAMIQQTEISAPAR